MNCQWCNHAFPPIEKRKTKFDRARQTRPLGIAILIPGLDLGVQLETWKLQLEALTGILV